MKEGNALASEATTAKIGNLLQFNLKYHAWYSRGLSVVKSLAPDRLDEFKRQHERDPKRKTLNAVTYVLEDYIHGVQAPLVLGDNLQRAPAFDINVAATVKLHNQIGIIASCASRLDDSLANIRGVAQADLFDSELDAARHLAKNGHLRAGGAVAGVVLETHLAEVCARHGIGMRKKAPHISDYNDALKQADVLDVPEWRWLQRLADIRNLCDHKKAREPRSDEVIELIDGVEKAIKTL